MSNIKVGIVEDELLIADEIADALHQLGYETTEAAISYTEALAMVERERPDILLLDIQLSGSKDGVDLAQRIKEDYNIPFIFLTANSDAATVNRAKPLMPHAYLVKPFNKDELYTSIEIGLHNFSIANRKHEPEEKENFIINDCLYIKQSKSLHKVKIDDILYLESNDVYIYVHTVTQKLLVRSTLQRYMELVGGKRFFKIHRSYAVNTNYIDTINADSIMVNKTELPMGKMYRDELLKFLPIG